MTTVTGISWGCFGFGKFVGFFSDSFSNALDAQRYLTHCYWTTGCAFVVERYGRRIVSTAEPNNFLTDHPCFIWLPFLFRSFQKCKAWFCGDCTERLACPVLEMLPRHPRSGEVSPSRHWGRRRRAFMSPMATLAAAMLSLTAMDTTPDTGTTITMIPRPIGTSGRRTWKYIPIPVSRSPGTLENRHSECLFAWLLDWFAWSDVE